MATIIIRVRQRGQMKTSQLQYTYTIEKVMAHVFILLLLALLENPPVHHTIPLVKIPYIRVVPAMIFGVNIVM